MSPTSVPDVHSTDPPSDAPSARRTAVRVARGVLLVALAGTTVLGGCSGDKKDVKQTKVLDETIGPRTCLDVPKDFKAEVSKLPVIDCTLEHTHEIFATYDLDTLDPPFSVYPGLEALENVAERQCTAAFEPYAGISPFDYEPKVFISWLVPTLKSWEDQKDRAVLCATARLDGSKWTGSIEKPTDDSTAPTGTDTPASTDVTPADSTPADSTSGG